MIMRKIILLFIIPLFYCCTVPFDAETRLIFEGKFVDSNENNLSGIDVEIHLSNGNGYGSSSETVSHGTTDENGEIKLVFPAAEFDKNYKININSNYEENLGYVPFSINNLKLENFPDYKLSIPKIYRLTNEESSNVYINFYSTNNFKKITSVEIIGIYSPSFSNDVDNDPNFTTSFYVKKNQTVQLIYKVQDSTTGSIETFSQDINVLEENIDLTINY